ncbi:MAG: TetR/AcrR family transcriptional regulator [Phenylobacterium sp.]|uniref:TetR/AcrR family transcriptional regulator n=1 Tax=Phenylobacterium sp. TaxID=1871053 RepID=UPI00391A8490
MSGKRPYTLRKRAESQDETRQRIVEATMHLHEEIGPRATTISAIAERAGVQRLTVYRHFPDETAVFQACTSHWLTLHPPPDPIAWSKVEDGLERARQALEAFYGYYAGTERMWTAAFRDVAEVPALQGPMAEVGAFMGAVGDDLIARLDPAAQNPALSATVRHALAFPTWRSLDELGLDHAQAVATAMIWIAAARG